MGAVLVGVAPVGISAGESGVASKVCHSVDVCQGGGI